MDTTVLTSEDGLTEHERAALDLVCERDGIHQSEIWKELGVSSRTGSRLVVSLLEKGLVDREKTVHEGRVTYYLEPTNDPRDLEFSLLVAGNQLSPLVGNEGVDPMSDEFTAWILALAYEE